MGLFRKTPLFDEQLQQLRTELSYFNRVIGGWPTRIHNAQEGQEVKKRWDGAVSAAQSLLKQRPESVDAKYVLADLLRMAHNMDVAGAAQTSHTLLSEILQTHPHHVEATYSLASLYVSIDPQAAPRAEGLFLKAETLAAPQVIPGIYQGLGFACLYQNKVPDAIRYFERYLQLYGDPEIQHLLDDLKSGKKPHVVSQAPLNQ